MSNILRLTQKKGYVGNSFVIAYEYPGRDAGLSWYKFNGKSYFGTTRFTEIINIEHINY